MRVEVPEVPKLKRCCFCMPLRHGLLAWGYIKSAVLLFFISVVTVDIVQTTVRLRTLRASTLIDLIFVLMMAADLCLSVVFIIGGHRKSPKLLHVYYIFNSILLVVYAVILTCITALELIFIAQYEGNSSAGFAEFIPFIQMKLIFGISVLGIQTYIILLVRSETYKLRNCAKYRFTNLRAQAEGV